MNIFVDCEASGPCIGCGDLIQFAAISESNEYFVSEKLYPKFDQFDNGAYNAIGITREIHLSYTGEYATEAKRFYDWLMKYDGRHTFWSDNPAFDWQWINYLFHSNKLANPFGFSARRIGDFYAGLERNIRKANDWKKFRVTKHTHDPLDDAKGNLEAFKHIRKTFNV